MTSRQQTSRDVAFVDNPLDFLNHPQVPGDQLLQSASNVIRTDLAKDSRPRDIFAALRAFSEPNEKERVEKLEEELNVVSGEAAELRAQVVEVHRGEPFIDERVQDATGPEREQEQDAATRVDECRAGMRTIALCSFCVKPLKPWAQNLHADRVLRLAWVCLCRYCDKGEGIERAGTLPRGGTQAQKQQRRNPTRCWRRGRDATAAIA